MRSGVGEETHWEGCLKKTAAELMELCEDLPNQQGYVGDAWN